MLEDDVKVIASLVDWSDDLIAKTFFKTFGSVLHQKFAEYEEAKTNIKEYIRNNFGADKVQKTPKRFNPAAKLLGQIQQMGMVSLNSDDSDEENRNPRQNVLRFSPRVLEHLQRVAQPCSVQPHSSEELQQKTFVPKKTTTAPPATTAETPKLQKQRAILSAQLSVPMVSAPSSVQSSANRGKVLTAFRKQEHQFRFKEKEIQAAKHREEILKDKAERARREREERQRRVEHNNRLREEQQKQKQELREQEERVRKYRQEQEELERAVRSPAAKTRKLGTPRSTKKQLLYASVQQQHCDNQPQLFAHHQQIQDEQHQLKQTLSDKENIVEEKLAMKLQENVILREDDISSDNDQEAADEQEEEEEEMDANEQAFLQENVEEQEIEEDLEEEEKMDEEILVEEEIDIVIEQHVSSVQENQQRLSAPAPSTSTQRISYDMTPDKIFLPSTKDNYNVDDLSSGDETDNEEHPRKDIPKWATKSNLLRTTAKLRTLITEEQRERHFGRIFQPNINDFFGRYEKKYAVRSSSAIWDSPMSDPTPGVGRFQAR